MAYVKILDNKHSAKVTINYIKNLEKTTEGLVFTNSVPGYEHMHFKSTKERWNKTKGVSHHHLVQAFNPGEITPEAAFELAKELATEKLKGFEYVIATHIDEAHIHTHIVFNSVNYETGRKFSRNAKKLQEVRDYSDYQCARDGYSIINDRNIRDVLTYDEWIERNSNMESQDELSSNKEYKKGLSYKEWLEINQGTSWKQKLRDVMDSVISYESVVDYKSFITELRNHGIDIKDKTSSGEERKWVSYKLDGMERYARDRSLGQDYYRDSIEARIDYKLKYHGQQLVTTNYAKRSSNYKPGYSRYYPKGKVYLVDIIFKLIRTVITTRAEAKVNKKYDNVRYFNKKIDSLNELLKYMDKHGIKNKDDLNDRINKFEDALKKYYMQLVDLENVTSFKPSESITNEIKDVKSNIDNTYNELKLLRVQSKVLKDINKSNIVKEEKIR